VLLVQDISDAAGYRHHKLRSWIGLRATHRHGANSMTGSHCPCDRDRSLRPPLARSPTARRAGAKPR
jgi:hypothetical protein